MTNVYFVRHAQAQGNVEKKFQGRIDLPLTPLGREQVEQVALRMKELPLDAVYTSPLQRAFDTAAGIGALHGMEPVVCQGIAEIDGGDMENRTFVQLSELYPEEFRLFLDEPHNFRGVGDGETMEAVFHRVRDAVLELVKKHNGQTLAVISHGAALRCFLCFASGLPLERMNDLPWGGNTSVSHVSFDEKLKPTVHTLFDASHLAEAPAPSFRSDDITKEAATR